MEPLNINLAVEGELDEAVAKKLLEVSARGYHVAACYGKRGKDYLRTKIAKFSQAAAITPYLVLADLDDKIECAPLLIQQWTPQPHADLMLRIAVREIEAWLLADSENFSRFLSVPLKSVPHAPEGILKPKEFIVNLAKRSKRREIREDIVPEKGSTSKVGKNYNGKLIEFVLLEWDINCARRSSPSLDKCLNAIDQFKE